MPLAQVGSFVLIQPQMNPQRNVCVLEGVRKIEISRRIVRRISASDQQDIDFARAHVSDEFSQRFGLIDRIRVDRIGVEDGLADVA